MKKSILLFAFFSLVCQISSCSKFPTETLSPNFIPPVPTHTLMPSVTPKQTSSIFPTTTPGAVSTADPNLKQYLNGAEALLSHSSTILFEKTQSFADVCPERYIAAFTFQTSRTDRRSLVVAFIGLPRVADGNVNNEQELLWTWRQEGLEPFEMDRVKWIERDDEWPLTLRVLGIFAGEWVVGIISGHCPGDDLHMVGLFRIENPDNFILEITRFGPDSAFDYWLQDGENLSHFRWEPWEASLISTLMHVPGLLMDVTWDNSCPDNNRDGVPDIVISWNMNSEEVKRSYFEEEQDLRRIGAD